MWGKALSKYITSAFSMTSNLIDDSPIFDLSILRSYDKNKMYKNNPDLSKMCLLALFFLLLA